MLNILITGNNFNTSSAVEDALQSSILDNETSIIHFDNKTPSFINKYDHYDALIIKIQLNDTTSLKLVKQVREYSDMPIIVVSDSNNIKLLIKYLEAGADNFITTPFNKNIFSASLKALIRRVN
ncbi:MAG: response regulator, partial [Eubacteriaceae bacterium]